MDRLIVFGAGGHAKVLLEAVFASFPQCEVAVVDDAAHGSGKAPLGFPVRGGRGWLEDHWPGVPVALGSGSNAARDELLDWLAGAGRTALAVVHPGALLSPSASLGAGVFLAPGAIVNAETRLGPGVIVNTGATIDHDGHIGRAVHVAPGAHLCGSVEVGERTLIGAGATVIPSIRIGSDAVVAAGAVVTRDVPDGGRVGGVPARPLPTKR
jgi:sugar O-acyltransferase (sialic acid O-acetyltransferase NeuD family)